MRSYGSSASYSIDLTQYQSALQAQSSQLQAQLTAQYQSTVAQLQNKTEVLTQQITADSGNIAAQGVTQLNSRATTGVNSIQDAVVLATTNITNLTDSKIAALTSQVAAAETERQELLDLVTQTHQTFITLGQEIAQIQPYVDSIVNAAQNQLDVDLQAERAVAVKAVSDQQILSVNAVAAQQTVSIGAVDQKKSQVLAAVQALNDSSAQGLNTIVSQGSTSITNLVNSGLAALDAANTTDLAAIQQAVTDASTASNDLSNIIGQSIQSYIDMQNIVNQAEPYVENVVNAQVQSGTNSLLTQENLSKQAIIAQQQQSITNVQSQQTQSINAVVAQQQSSISSLTSVTDAGVVTLNSTRDIDLTAISTQFNSSISSIGAAQGVSIAALQAARDNYLGSLQQAQTQSITALTQQVSIGNTALESTFTQLQGQLQTMINQIQNSTAGGGSGLLVGTIVYTSNIEQWVNSTKWLPCNGAQFDPTVFPQLHQFLGTTNLPNLNGQFVRCLDPSGQRQVLSTQAESVGSHSHAVSLSSDMGGIHDHSIPALAGTGTTNTIGNHVHRENGYTAGGVGGTSNVATSNSDVVVYNADGQPCTAGKSLLPDTDGGGAHSHTVTISTAVGVTASSGAHSHLVSGNTALFGGENIPANVGLYAIIKTDNS